MPTFTAYTKVQTDALLAGKAPTASPAFTGMPTIGGVPVARTTDIPAGGWTAAATYDAAIAKLHGLFATRNDRTVVVASLGDSNAFGSGATAGQARWFDRLQQYLTDAYPLDNGATNPTEADYLGFDASPGVRVFGGGAPSARSDQYLTQALIDGLTAKSTSLYMHTIGTNDWLQNIDPAVFKTNMLANIAAIKAAQAAPAVHLLIHMHVDSSTKAYPWSAYGDAMAQIAAADPTNVAYLDFAAAIAPLGVPGTDPFSFATQVHLYARGQAFLADEVRRVLRLPGRATSINSTVTADTTAPTAPTGLTASGAAGQVVLSWTAATDNVAVTGYRVYRGGTLIGSPSGTTYTDTVAAGTYSYTVAAVDAAGNVSAQTGAVSGTSTSAPQTLTNSTAPTVTGTATQGQTLAASNGSWSATPDGYTYQWNRAGAAISGATASSYTLTSADVGATITVTVTATKAGYTAASASSAATAAVAAAAGGATVTETWTAADGTAWPAQWTVHGATATVQAGRGRLVTSSYWTGALLSGMTATAGDFDIVASWQMAGNTGNSTVIIGVSDVINDGSSKPKTGFAVGCTIVGTGNASGGGTVGGQLLGSYANGAETAVAQSYATVTPSASGFTTRIKRTGTTLQARTWPAGTAEPTSWAVSGTVASPAVAGRGFLSGGDQAYITTDFDDYAITA